MDLQLNGKNVLVTGSSQGIGLAIATLLHTEGCNITLNGRNSDVLENVPSVSVDIDGNIELRGNNNVRILVDGKPSGLIGLGGIDALTRLPAESIEKVESASFN